MITKIISKSSTGVVIEWVEEGKVHRSIVPKEDVSNNGECLYPERGIPYGLPFEQLLHVDLTSEDITDALHNAGIWTMEDLLRRPSEVHGVLNILTGHILQTLLRNARVLK